MEVQRFARQDDPAVQPRLDGHAQGAELPVLVVADPRPHLQLGVVGHQVRVGLEQAQHLRPDTFLLGVLDAEVDVPLGGIDEVEVGLGAAADVDQLAAGAEAVLGVQAGDEVARELVEDQQRAEDRVIGELGALLEHVGLALQQDHRTREGDDEQEAAVEGEAVVGVGADGHAAAERERSGQRIPLGRELGDSLRGALVPAGAAVGLLEPVLGRRLVGRHLDRHQARDPVEP